jgi:hypothetical protein
MEVKASVIGLGSLFIATYAQRNTSDASRLIVVSDY